MENETGKDQVLTVINREIFKGGLVEDILSFTDEEIVLKTKLGGLRVCGKGLKLSDFSVENGTIELMGKVNSAVFSEIKEKRSFLKGLFR